MYTDRTEEKGISVSFLSKGDSYMIPEITQKNVQLSWCVEEITATPFYIAYMDFRKKLECEKFAESEWENIFEIELRKSVIRHPEDFE